MSSQKTAASTAPDTRTQLLESAATCLRTYGYAGLSTRRVAEAAGMPLSQIHYHFGSKDALVLALLDHQNLRLVQRQRTMFAASLPLWKRWDLACDYLDQDIASGYVRILQEMIAAGWSNLDIAAAVQKSLAEWQALLTRVSEEACATLGQPGTLLPAELACLVGNVFLGSEALLLLGFEDQGLPIRSALRRIGAVIRTIEESRTTGMGNASKASRRARPRRP